MASWYTSNFAPPSKSKEKSGTEKFGSSKRGSVASSAASQRSTAGGGGGSSARRLITTSPRDDGAGPLLSPLRAASSAKRLVSAEGGSIERLDSSRPPSATSLSGGGGSTRPPSSSRHHRGLSNVVEPFGGPAAARRRESDAEDDKALDARAGAEVAARVAGEEYKGFAERREPEPFMYPEYDGTKKAEASDQEKKRFHLARLQRMAIIREQMRPQLLAKPPKPRGVLSVHSSSSVVRVIENVNELRRPHGVHPGYNRAVYCQCRNCKDNREVMLKADRWWLTGAQEKALGYKKHDCANLMPASYCAIQFRSLRGVVRKGTTPGWKRPIIDQLQLNEQELEQMREDVLKVDTHDYAKLLPTYHEIQKAIAEADREIQNLLGSADWTAEVCVVVSSFGAVCTEFFKSYRILRFLEMKGVDHFTIDINKDIGTDSVDYKLIRKVYAANRLPLDPKKVSLKAECPLVAPIVLVDGVPLGDYAELLTQEDEGDLDYVLSRAACANCLADRKPSQKHCLRCGAKFEPLISPETCSEEEMKILVVRSEYNAGRIKAPSPLEWERRRRRLCLVHVGEDPSQWIAERHKFGAPSLGFAVTFD